MARPENEAPWYDTAQVCQEGHLITDFADSQPETKKNFCPKCGAATITACPNCSSKIKGFKHFSGVVSLDFQLDSFCDNCGCPYPWSDSKLKAAIDLSAELEGLTDQEREDLKKSLPDLLRNVPNTSVAATRFKRIIRKASNKGGELMWEILKDVASDAAKKIILGGS
jgi:hypothetical protein